MSTLDSIYVASRKISDQDIESMLFASRFYLLEEIALNIRAKSKFRALSEYYPGGYPKPLCNIFNSTYEYSLQELGGIFFGNKTFEFLVM